MILSLTVVALPAITLASWGTANAAQVKRHECGRTLWTRYLEQLFYINNVF